MDESTFLAALESVLDKTVGEAAQSNSDRHRLQKKIAALCARAAKETIERVADERNASANRVKDAVGDYCQRCMGSTLASLVNDNRIPHSINYLKRYRAFRGMGDRTQLLSSIEQTIDLAESRCVDIAASDIDAAFHDAATRYMRDIQKLGALQVCQCTKSKEVVPESIVRTLDRSSADTKRFQAELVELVEGAFSGVVSEDVFDSSLVNDATKTEKTVRDSLVRAAADARKNADEILQSKALSIVSAALPVNDLPQFTGSVCVTRQVAPPDVHALTTEVRASFKTYSAVVRDNGVFAAFSDGSDYGKCVGFSDWISVWDDWGAETYGFDNTEYHGDIPGIRYVDGIASTVEEDEPRGDSLERSIERMREFNSRRYMGVFDDDFKQHVDAFWYGFRKLMEYVNGMYAVDASAFHDYCSLLRKVIESQAFALGMKMDGVQLEDYLKKVSNLTEDLEVAHG